MTNPSQVVFEDSDDKERNPTVRKILSNVAGVSEDTYSKGKKILDSDNKELKQEVLSGEKSINAGYKELTQGKNKKTNENEKLTTWLEGLKNDKNEEVMQWMLDIQLGRRNLIPIQRIAVAEKYRPIYERQAKERQAEYHGNQYDKKSGLTGNLPQVQNSKERNPTTDKILSGIAGVSEKTYRMGAKVLKSDNEDIKQRAV